MWIYANSMPNCIGGRTRANAKIVFCSLFTVFRSSSCIVDSKPLWIIKRIRPTNHRPAWNGRISQSRPNIERENTQMPRNSRTFTSGPLANQSQDGGLLLAHTLAHGTAAWIRLGQMSPRTSKGEMSSAKGLAPFWLKERKCSLTRQVDSKVEKQSSGDAGEDEFLKL